MLENDKVQDGVAIAAKPQKNMSQASPVTDLNNRWIVPRRGHVTEREFVHFVVVAIAGRSVNRPLLGNCWRGFDD